MPIACIVVPNFALRIAILEQPTLDGLPLVLGSPPGARPLVRDATPAAAAHGIRPGLGLREVTALCPDAVIIEPHPTRELAFTELLLEKFSQLSPLVEASAEHAGCWFIDLRGAERQLGPPRVALARLLAAVPPLLHASGGVAAGKFTARVAASFTQPGERCVIAPADAPRFLDSVPVDILPAPPETVRRLERLGLRSLGDIARLPMTAMQARFGKDGRAWWDLANGSDPEPVRPRPPLDSLQETMELPAPATSRETLVIALAQLAARAFGRPALQACHVRQVRLRALLEGDRAWEQITTLREPGGQQRVLTAVGYRLDTLSLPAAATHLTLELRGLIPVEGRQELLPGLRAKRPRELVEAAAHLKQRFGQSGLYRVVEVEPWSRIPERRLALIAYDH